MRTFRVLSGLLVLWLLGACAAPPPTDPDLERLEIVARYLTSARHLRQTAYPALRQNDRPSAYLSYLFSDIGVAEWPPTDTGDEMQREQMQTIHTPMFPPNGALVFQRPDSRFGKQLVLSADDDAGEFIARGYLTPTEEAVTMTRWTMPSFRDAPAR